MQVMYSVYTVLLYVLHLIQCEIFKIAFFPVSNVRSSLKFTIIFFYFKISSVEMDLPESGFIRKIFSKGRCAEISAKFAVPLSGESHLSLPTPPCVGNYDRI
jgi:hypothetical protein